MVICELLLLGNPTLRKKSKEVNNFSKISEIFVNLKDTLTDLQSKFGMGRGLAAPQIGYKKQVIYIQTQDRNSYFVNPRIVDHSSEMFDVWDSCFSMKAKFFVKIPRYKSITVEYYDKNKIKHVEKFEDSLSELLQHEIDHLEGVLCVDYLNDPKDIVMYEEWNKRYRKQGIGM
jgi:peptide deformylase